MRGRPLDAIIGEVRLDNPWLRRPVRRVRALAPDFPCYQPSMSLALSPVPLVLHGQPLTRSRLSLAVGELQRRLYALWRRLDRIPRPLERPAFRRMLAALRGRRRACNRHPAPPRGPAARPGSPWATRCR